MKTLNELKDERKLLLTKIYNLKTKPAKRKVWDKISDIELQIENIYKTIAEPYLNRRIKGTIMYSGTEVLVRCELGTIEINACNDKLSKSWYNETCCVSFIRDTEVEFEVIIDSISFQGVIFLAKDVSGGIFSAEEYEKLNKNPNLAFFKYSDDKMSGLFKK